MASAEYFTLVATSDVISNSLSADPLAVAMKLFAKSLIPPGVLASVRMASKTNEEKATEIVERIIIKVEHFPEYFELFLEIIGEHLWLKDLVKLIRKTYEENIQSHKKEAMPKLERPADNNSDRGVSTVCAVQEFTETMTPDELCSWLHRCYQMPPDDCKTMKDKNIGGVAFKVITEGEKWNDLGISVVGLILLNGPIMKEICPAVPDPGKREMTTVLAVRSSASNGGGSGCGLAQGNSTHNTSGTIEACAPSLPASALPASARPYLKLQLDWGHEGVDRDLIEIAHLMVGWEEKLCPHLGLTDVDVHDIREKYKEKPELQRREALRIWKNNQGLCATYENLLELFVRARHAQCAEAVREIIRMKF